MHQPTPSRNKKRDDGFNLNASRTKYCPCFVVDLLLNVFTECFLIIIIDVHYYMNVVFVI